MLSSVIAHLLVLASLVHGQPTGRAVDGPTVSLGYATYQGRRLAAGVDEYLGMRYAKAPVGNLRFRAPQEPCAYSSVQNATAFGPICVGVNQTITSSRTEDCLFVNVFKPSNATEDSKLPVWVYIQGGAWLENANANYNGTDVIQKSGYNLVFVNFNYRVGALGFLAGEEVSANGDLNAGLLDQRLLLQWVQKYISQFGGDPNHVVIHGASAGATSIGHHMTAYGGRDDHLFVAGVPESTFWVIEPKASEMQFQYDRFVNDTGCSGSTDTLQCLRSLPLSTIQEGNLPSPFPNTTDNPLVSWYFVPVIDGTLIVDTLYNLFEQGRFVRVPMLVGDDTNEGATFAPNATTSQDMLNFFKNNYPHLTDAQLQEINNTYPQLPPLPKHNAYFPTASEAYGDATFICPGNLQAESVAQYVSPDQVWNYRYNVLDPANVAAGEGVPHTFETSAIFGPGFANNPAASYYTTNAEIVPIVMDYWISFIVSLNPNTFRAPGAPVWEPWGTGTGQRLLLQTNATQMEAVPGNTTANCAMWKSLAATMEV